jgi:hypothetical protein
MLIKIEYEFDPKFDITPYFAKVGDRYFSATSFKEARNRAIEYFKATKLVVVPPPEEVDIGGDE